MVRLAFVLLLLAALLLACGAPTSPAQSTESPSTAPTRPPTVPPTNAPTQLPTARPLLNVTLTTGSLNYKPGKAEIEITLTNHGDEPIYLPICGPWSLADAESLRDFWFIECEIDYLGHKVEPGASYAGSLALFIDEGSYRVRTWVYGDCTLGEPKVISPRETYYGEFHECAVWEEAMSDPFGVE